MVPLPYKRWLLSRHTSFGSLKLPCQHTSQPQSDHSGSCCIMPVNISLHDKTGSHVQAERCTRHRNQPQCVPAHRLEAMQARHASQSATSLGQRFRQSMMACAAPMTCESALQQQLDLYPNQVDHVAPFFPSWPKAKRFTFFV